MNPADVKHAIPGHDAVVISLGNPQLPIAISLGARRTTPADICEMGTRNIVAMLGPNSPVRVLAVTAYGVGDTHHKMSITFKILVSALHAGTHGRQGAPGSGSEGIRPRLCSGAAGGAAGCSSVWRLGGRRKGRNPKDAHIAQGRGRVHRR